MNNKSEIEEIFKNLEDNEYIEIYNAESLFQSGLDFWFKTIISNYRYFEEEDESFFLRDIYHTKSIYIVVLKKGENKYLSDRNNEELDRRFSRICQIILNQLK